MDRLWNRVQKDADGCWRWTGAHIGDGYGNLWVAGKSRLAHRVAYELLVGPIPAGLEIDHLCRVRDCVNPEHLEVVTGKENALRGISFAAENAVKEECVNGHPFDDVNTYRRPNGNRDCRVCGRERAARYRARLVEKVAA
jgi:hypothetical protein